MTARSLEYVFRDILIGRKQDIRKRHRIRSLPQAFLRSSAGHVNEIYNWLDSGEAMAPKRKHSANENYHHDAKRQKIIENPSFNRYPVLSLYYPHISSLRDYLLSRFPKSSKSRRQRLKSIPLWYSKRRGHLSSDHPATASPSVLYVLSESYLCEEEELSKLLDTTVIGYGEETRFSSQEFVPRDDLKSLSQKLRSTVGSSVGNDNVTQSEVKGTQIRSHN